MLKILPEVARKTITIGILAAGILILFCLGIYFTKQKGKHEIAVVKHVEAAQQAEVVANAKKASADAKAALAISQKRRNEVTAEQIMRTAVVVSPANVDTSVFGTAIFALPEGVPVPVSDLVEQLHILVRGQKVELDRIYAAFSDRGDEAEAMRLALSHQKEATKESQKEVKAANRRTWVVGASGLLALLLLLLL